MGRYIPRNSLNILLPLLFVSAFGASILLTVDRGLFFTQIGFIFICVIAFFLISSIDTAVLEWISPFSYVLGCLLLAVTYLGPTIRGVTRWIIIAGVQLQPSELVKPFLLLGFSHFIVKYPPRTLKNIALQVFLFLIPLFLVFRQPDLGSSIIYVFLWTAMMIAGGLPLWVLASSIFLLVLGAPFGWHILAGYQKLRIITFFAPTLEPLGAGYNAIQSTIAVGSGQLFGKGLGLGTQSHFRFLPEFHTDFIFATLVEEFGFVGGALLLVSYAYLGFVIIRPFLFQRTYPPQFFLYSMGLLTMLVVQVGINCGMNMGMVPITGITLPLVSYGGSSLVGLISSFGLLSSFERASQKNTEIEMPV